MHINEQKFLFVLLSNRENRIIFLTWQRLKNYVQKERGAYKILSKLHETFPMIHRGPLTFNLILVSRSLYSRGGPDVREFN